MIMKMTHAESLRSAPEVVVDLYTAVFSEVKGRAAVIGLSLINGLEKTVPANDGSNEVMGAIFLMNALLETAIDNALHTFEDADATDKMVKQLRADFEANLKAALITHNIKRSVNVGKL